MGFDSRRWTGRDALGALSLEHRQPPPARYRAVRWILAALIVTALAAAIAQIGLGRLDSRNSLLSVSLLASGVGAASGFSSFARARARYYDEFERLVVAEAHRRAYAAVIGLIMIAFGWCAAATAHGWPMPRRPMDWIIWAVALLVIARNLPVMMSEFAIPFPDREDAA